MKRPAPIGALSARAQHCFRALAGSPAAFGLVRHHLLLLHDHAMALFNFLPRTGWLKQAGRQPGTAPPRLAQIPAERESLRRFNYLHVIWWNNGQQQQFLLPVSMPTDKEEHLHHLPNDEF